MWECDLEKVWGLPVGTGKLHDDGKYCAVGLVMAGCIGEFSHYDVLQWEPNPTKLLLEALSEIGCGPILGIKFDREIEKNPKNAKMIREKYVRIILQRAMAAGIIKIKDSDLDIVRELKAESVSV